MDILNFYGKKIFYTRRKKIEFWILVQCQLFTVVDQQETSPTP